MTIRSMSTALLTAAVVSLGTPGPARAAGVLSWLDKLSGPGPFLMHEVRFAVKCWPGPVNEQGQRIHVQDVHTKMISLIVGCRNVDPAKFRTAVYVNFDFGSASDNPIQYADRDRNLSRAVWLFRSGAAVDFGVHPALELGAGWSQAIFNGERFDAFSRPMIRFRASFRPLMLGWNPEAPRFDQLRKRYWLVLWAERSVLLGTIDGADFGAPDDPFRSSDEWLWELGFGLDIGSWLPIQPKP